MSDTETKPTDVDAILFELQLRISEGRTILVRPESAQAILDEVTVLRNRLREVTALPEKSHSYLRRGAHDTERKAARNRLSKRETQQVRILRVLVAAGDYGATDEEIQQAVIVKGKPLKPQSETPRRLELVEGGWVAETTRRRRTETGDQAIVWVATEKGRQAISERMPV